MAIIILLFAFGTAVAMAMPIVTAIFGLSAGLEPDRPARPRRLGPVVAPTLGTMLGLGVGIDYALFIVTRYRGCIGRGPRRRGGGRARDRRPPASAVVFAGSTVVIALLSLLLRGHPDRHARSATRRRSSSWSR